MGPADRGGRLETRFVVIFIYFVFSFEHCTCYLFVPLVRNLLLMNSLLFFLNTFQFQESIILLFSYVHVRFF